MGNDELWVDVRRGSDRSEWRRVGGETPTELANPRTAALAACIVAMVAMALSAPTWGWWADFSPDGFYYLTIARRLWETGQVSEGRIMAPPGFPILLAPFFTWGELPLLPLRILFALSWAGAATATYLLHRDALGERLAWIAGLFVATSPTLLTLSQSPLSETVFIPTLAASLVFLRRWWRRPVSGVAEACAVGLLSAAVCLTRSAGIILPPIMAIALLRHGMHGVGRRFLPLAAFGLCAVGPLLAWHARQRAYPDGPSYGRHWTAPRDCEETSATGVALQIERLARYGPKRLEAIKEATLPQSLAWRLFRPPLKRPATLLIGGFFVAAAAISLVVRRDPADLFAMATIGMLAVWPFDEGPRFVAPLLPIFVGYPLWIGRALWRRSARGGFRRVALLVVLGSALLAQGIEIKLLLNRAPARAEKAQRRMAEMHEIAAWLREHVAEGQAWYGVTADADSVKVLLVGGAYLARRPMTAVDLRAGHAWECDGPLPTPALVHRSVYAPRFDDQAPKSTAGPSEFVAVTRPRTGG